MSCYKPLCGFLTASGGVVFSELKRHGDITRDIAIACGQCIGCRYRRASDWELRVMHEASRHEETCFVTLTYGRDQLPANGSLCHDDFQRFMKRVRKVYGPVRFYMCGEYGPKELRPHYHACLFGVSFRELRSVLGRSASGQVYFDQPVLRALWKHGRVSVQDLTAETAGYCARYIMKKVLGKDADAAYTRVDNDGCIVSVDAEYSAMSLKPGIGASWFDKYGAGVYPNDFVVSGGVKRTPAKYYDKLIRRRNAEQFEQLKFAREERASAHWREQFPDRLAAREAVHVARVSTLSRGLE